MEKRFDYRAEIVGGSGDKAWHGEMTCSAENILRAAEYFQHRVTETDAIVVSIEQLDELPNAE